MNEEDKNQKLLKKQLKNLNDKTEHIQKIMEKGKDTVVVRIGSHFTKFGFANSDSPFIIPTNLISKANWVSPCDNSDNSRGAWMKATRNIQTLRDELNQLQNGIQPGTSLSVGAIELTPENQDESISNEHENQVTEKKQILKQKEAELEMAFNNIESIKEEMLANNFLPNEMELEKVLRFQDAINRNEHSNFTFLNKVLESMNTLKQEVIIPKGDPESDKSPQPEAPQEPAALDIESDGDNESSSRHRFKVNLRRD